jgi:hypothetical protein
VAGVVDVVVSFEPVELVDPAAVVGVEALLVCLLPLLPQATAISDRPTRPAPMRVTRDLLTFPPFGFAPEHGDPANGRVIEATAARSGQPAADYRQLISGGSKDGDREVTAVGARGASA